MKRLLEGELPGRAASLLRSATADVPPKSAEEKARLVSVVANVAAARNARSAFSAGKWLGLLSLIVVSGGLAAGGYFISPSVHTTSPLAVESKSGSSSSGSSTASEVSRPHVAAAESVETTATPEAVPAASPAKSIDVSALPTATDVTLALRTKAPAGATSNAAPKAGAETSRLEDELAVVDGARAAFVDGKPALALARVHTYRKRYPSGHFGAETDALEIQALVALHRTDEARSKADRFLADRPDSPYAQRVRSAIAAKP